MLDFDQLVNKIKGWSSTVREDRKAKPQAIDLDSADLFKVCSYLYADPETYFDSLSCITGIDQDQETMMVVYNIYSIPFNHHLMLRVAINRDEPEIDSLVPIWKTAEWHEREAYDLLGIKFKNHPDLRRILLPSDWTGFPLRKDYEEQQLYRGVNVAY